MSDVTIVSFSLRFSLFSRCVSISGWGRLWRRGARVLAHDAVTAHMLAFDMCVYYMSTHRGGPRLRLHQPNEYVGVSVPLPLFPDSFFLRSLCLSLWPGTVTNLVYLEPIHLAGRQAKE